MVKFVTENKLFETMFDCPKAFCWKKWIPLATMLKFNLVVAKWISFNLAVMLEKCCTLAVYSPSGISVGSIVRFIEINSRSNLPNTDTDGLHWCVSWNLSKSTKLSGKLSQCLGVIFNFESKTFFCVNNVIRTLSKRVNPFGDDVEIQAAGRKVN